MVERVSGVLSADFGRQEEVKRQRKETI